MTPLHNIGRILRDVYEQHQPQLPTPDKPDVPRLAGGLWGAFKFEEAAEKYKQRLEEQYGFLHILGHHKHVPLEGVFTDVYLYDRPLALRRLGVAELEEQFRQRRSEQKGTKRVDGLALVRKERKLFILGQPGAGKTTFLKHITLQAAKGELPGVPVFIALKALADSEKPLFDFMAQEMQICGFPEPDAFLKVMLQAGKLLILLDGLDEVTQAQEAKLNLTQGIENAIRQYGDNHFLITCRTAVTDYQFSRFTSVEMADFSPEQVTVFIRKWFQDDAATGEACLLELSRDEQQGLRDLARTPLLLNLLCLTYDEVGHFPQRRVGLYEEALNALLVKWDSSRRIHRDEVYRYLDLGRKRHLLARIAAETFGKGKYFIPKNEMVGYILDYLQTIPGSEQLSESIGEGVLRAIEAQHGILVERARQVYGFAHLTFQEYFTAKYVAEAGEKSWINLFPHCAEPQWREVFLLTTTLLNEADDFLLQFSNYLNKFVLDDPVLINLLTWVNEKANEECGQSNFSFAEYGSKESTIKLIFLRGLYLYLGVVYKFTDSHIQTVVRSFVANIRDTFSSDLYFNHWSGKPYTKALLLEDMIYKIVESDHELDVFSLPYDLGFGNRSPQGKALTRSFTQTRDRDRALTISRLNDNDRVNDNLRTKAVARSLTEFSPTLALDFALVYGCEYGRFGFAKPFVDLALKLSREQHLRTLELSLKRLVAPDQNAPEKKRAEFVRRLSGIATRERRIIDLRLDAKQTKRLVFLAEGTRLFFECLRLADVKDREGILARLLASPPA